MSSIWQVKPRTSKVTYSREEAEEEEEVEIIYGVNKHNKAQSIIINILNIGLINQ